MPGNIATPMSRLSGAFLLTPGLRKNLCTPSAQSQKSRPKDSRGPCPSAYTDSASLELAENGPPSEYRREHMQVADLLGGNLHDVTGEDDEVCIFAGLDRSFHFLLEGRVGAVD